jgi:hypothetical protein
LKQAEREEEEANREIEDATEEDESERTTKPSGENDD